MVSIKDRKILRQMFSHYDYVMTTAQLSKEKLYYRDIQRMLGAGLIEKVKRGYYHWTMGSGKGDVVITAVYSPMVFYVWKQLYSIMGTAIEILRSGTLLLIKTLPDNARE